MGQPLPAPGVVNGLRHLVNDLKATPESVHSGLSGIVFGETDLIGFGDRRVNYCGVDVESLCVDHSFEASAWLLLHQHLPDEEQLADLNAILIDAAVVDQPVADMIGTVPLQTRPLDLLPLSIQLLSCFDPTPGDRSSAASLSQFWRLIAQLPVLLHVAFGGQLNDGRIPESEDARPLSYAGQLLQVLRDDDQTPLAVEEKAMDAVLSCVCLTELRAACFSARFFGSAVNDIVAGLKSASSMFVSQLRNDPYQWIADRLSSFQSPICAETWWQKRSSQSMPFGFSEEPEDLRSTILRQHCRELLGSVPAMVLESSASRLESLLAARGLNPTLDWTAARALTLLKVPADRISLAIGIARLIGWAAQTMEQHRSGISLLPTLRYPGNSGATDRC